MSDDGRFVARDLHTLLHCEGRRVVWYVATRTDCPSPSSLWWMPEHLPPAPSN
jgi:hypothetical protein